jgi:heme A synthase
MGEKETGAELRKYVWLSLVSSILLFIGALTVDDAELREMLMVESQLALLTFWVLFNIVVVMGGGNWNRRRNDKHRGLCRVTSQESHDTGGPDLDHNPK